MTNQQSPLILVTGATDGIGKETALELTRRGARVIIHGRNPKRIDEMVRTLAALGREPPEPLQGDLSSLAEVRRMAEEMKRRDEKPSVLLNNAGVYMKERKLSPDGFEMTMAVNHLAPFLLTHLLLEGDTGDALGRIVNVSSVAHTRGQVDLDDIAGTRRSFEPYALYAASKLANVLFTVELARRLAPRGITVNALHPGVVSTKLLTEGFEMSGSDSLETGAATSVMLTLSAEGGATTGRYFSNRREAPMNPVARDRDFCQRFYEKSAELVGISGLPLPAE